MRVLIALLMVVLGAPVAVAAPTAAIVGGDTVLVNGVPCRVAFNAKTPANAHRVIVLGACTGSAQPVTAAVPPPGSTPTAQVRVGSRLVTVTGTRSPAIGSSVCVSSPTSGHRCGTVLAVNQTVNFPGGAITGLTRTNICFAPGDAGSPVLAGTLAVGVLLAGSGSCAVGGTSYHVPINQVLSQNGLALYVG